MVTSIVSGLMLGAGAPAMNKTELTYPHIRQIPVLALTSCGTLGKPQFPILKQVNVYKD